MATIKRKRTALDAFLPGPSEARNNPETEGEASPKLKQTKTRDVRREVQNRTPQNEIATDSEIAEKAKHEITKYMLYLPLPISEQLRTLHFEEQRGQIKKSKLHDYFMEAIDLLFKDRGLKSIHELLNKTD